MTSSFAKLGKLTKSTDESWDIIVVGAGHNGLITAAYLATAGKKVLILERNKYAGGGVVSMEMAEPGFTSERHATIHHLLLANPIITRDELGLFSRYGLKYIPVDVPYAVITDKSCLVLYQNRQRTIAGMKQFSEEDASSFDKFMDIAIGITEILVPPMFEPPRDLSAEIARSPYANYIAEASNMSSVEITKKWFKHEVVQIAFIRLNSEVQLMDPHKPNTGLMLYLLCGMLENYGMAIPEGGGTGWTSSVIHCIEANGGQIRLDSEVTKIITENGRATGVRTRLGEIRAKDAIIGQIHPHLLGQYVDGLDPVLLSKAGKTVHADYTGFLIHAALREPLKMKAGPTAEQAVFNTICAPSLDQLLENYEDLNKRNLPRHAHFGASCTSGIDTSRAPAGKAVLHLFCMTKYDILEGPHIWDKIKDKYVFEILSQLAPFTHNLTPDLVSSYHVVTPLDHERDTPSFQRGDIIGIAHTADQMGVNRPTRELAQYRVPGVKGLYLAGPFMHPGGGVWGGGRATALRVFEDLKIDFDAKVVKKNATQSMVKL